MSSVLLEELQDKYDELEVRTLDLFSADLPAVAGSNINSKYALMTGQALDGEARRSWSEIERTIEGFLNADVYLLTVPMWNFGIPYALKYYIDAIVQPGYLFRYNELGQPEPLVHGKKMICVTTRGRRLLPDRMAPFDYVETYLRAIFGFVGISDITFFNVQPMDVTADLRREAFRKAVGDVRAWVAGGALDDEPSAPVDALPAGVKPQVIVE